jgi:hypothetical protein
MLKRFSHFFAYLLLLLIPLQGLAAANMSVCNSLMQLAGETKTSAMPCHMANMKMADMTKTSDNCKHKNTCKTSCAALCASLSGITAVTQTAPAMPVIAASQAIAAHNETYTSYSPPNLQRPPIFLA